MSKNFAQAFEQLRKAVELAQRRELTELEEQGIIHTFEYTHELAWNTLKDFLDSKGRREIFGSKDTSREAFKRGLIENGEAWMDMIKSRNLISHTYNIDVAKQIVGDIQHRYCEEFERLKILLMKRHVIKVENLHV